MDSSPASPAKPDFSNTELAFRYKSDAELKSTWKTFRKINSKFLSKVGPFLVKIGFALRLPIKGIVKKTLFNVFCGGESLEDTVACSEKLDKFGVKTILDYSVEGKKDREGLDATANEIIRTIQHSYNHSAVDFSAMKMTGIAEVSLMEKIQKKIALNADEESHCKDAIDRLDKICSKAFELKQKLFIDAEETWIQDAIDQWAEMMMEKYNKETQLIYTTIQMYRHDRLEYLRGLIERSKQKGFLVGVKIVRGAYMEKEREHAKQGNYRDPIQPDKKSTDKDFDEALRISVENVDRVAICCGTHNEKSCLYLVDLMEQKKLQPGHPNILFAQLLGMSDNISFNLAHKGFNVGKYLPYGPVKAVMPYLLRRADENSSIAGQSSRELVMLEREMKRRGENRG